MYIIWLGCMQVGLQGQHLTCNPIFLVTQDSWHIIQKIPPFLPHPLMSKFVFLLCNGFPLGNQEDGVQFRSQIGKSEGAKENKVIVDWLRMFVCSQYQLVSGAFQIQNFILQWTSLIGPWNYFYDETLETPQHRVFTPNLNIQTYRSQFFPAM